MTAIEIKKPVPEPIIVAVSFDTAYAEHATVMLRSLLASNIESTFIIHVFLNELNEAVRQKIRRSFSGFNNFTIEWLAIDPSLISNFTIRKGHVNEYTYTRIFVAHYLKKFRRFLYLDCDMIVTAPIATLWATDLEGKTIGAVQDPSPFNRYADLQMPDGHPYFNAGVLLVDAERWLAKGYSQKVVDTLMNLGGKAAMWDQDGLNATLYHDCKLLPQKWNIQSHHIAVAQEEGCKDVKALLSPAIVHFTGNLKPWNFKSTNPFKKDYYKVLKQTEFHATHVPKNKTWLNIARRTVRNTLVFAGLIKY